MELLQELFHVKEKGSSLRTELLASATSFFSIVYIVAVNALILSQAGMDYNSVVIATILTTAVSNILMGLYANSPLILAPGMSAGVGFFLIFLGLKNGGIIVSSEGTIVALNNIFQPVPLTLLATLLVGLILFVKNVKGNFLLTIIFGVLISIALGVTDISSFSYSFIDLGSLEPFVFQLDFSGVLSMDYWVAVFSLLILVVFQNLGTQVSFLTSEQPKVLKRTLESNALSVMIAGLLGCSSICTSAEGATSIAV
ncbi:xanthine/uracil/vitamin c permease [Trichococcus flocculiformis]|uniref:MFS transporter, AGZA family, xanthine/uracil permease n=3 Tax=Trichococcus TaxID=82802 RepID=A0AB38BL25_9LACT|nr:xanthine/uracil/vitamin c permease [Trichococcus flocculiformis]SFI14064.1 putative MFS transporter, AGZA family, xanthine/uracil permease [Trichococcus flocculiformis]